MLLRLSFSAGKHKCFYGCCKAKEKKERTRLTAFNRVWTGFFMLRKFFNHLQVKGILYDPPVLKRRSKCPSHVYVSAKWLLKLMIP